MNFYFTALSHIPQWEDEAMGDRFRTLRNRNPDTPKCSISCGRCGCECGECPSLKKMINFQSETTASSAGDFLASTNFWICDTTLFLFSLILEDWKNKSEEWTVTAPNGQDFKTLQHLPRSSFPGNINTLRDSMSSTKSSINDVRKFTF